jgi:hypothetical protein
VSELLIFHLSRHISAPLHPPSLRLIMASRITMSRTPDVEKSTTPPQSYPPQPARANTQPFIGRLGGNQGFVLDRNDSANASFLKDIPDAAPYMSLKEQLDLRGFKYLGLWKSALAEGMGMFPQIKFRSLNVGEEEGKRTLMKSVE